MRAFAIALCSLAAACNCGSVGAKKPNGGHGTVAGLAVSPATSQLDCPLGKTASETLTATATYSDGSSALVAASWSNDNARVAAAGAGGVVTASGTLGGAVNVTAAFQGKTASAVVNVVIDSTTGAGGGAFGTPGTDPARTPNVVYPYDHVLFPRNVYPPLVQWDAGSGNDVWRVTLEGQFAKVVAIVTQPQYQPAAGEWKALALPAAGGQPVTVTVDGASSSDATHTYFTGTPISMEFAPSDFSGQIYYWELSKGAIARIRSDWQHELLWTPPANPANNSTCFACHALSADGKKMAFTYWGGSGPMGVIDVQNPSPPLLPPGGTISNWTTFDPSGNYLLGVNNRRMALYDGAGNAVSGVIAGGDYPAPGATMARFSPDGTRLAYVQFADDSWEIDFTQSDLHELSVVAGAPPTFANDVTLDTGAAAPAGMAGQGALSYPTFSPDSKLLVYGRGEHSRSGFDAKDQSATSPILYKGDLMLLEGAAAPVPLAKLGHDDHDYAPAFAPFSGGVYWLAFMSRRDYGNVLKGPACQVKAGATYGVQCRQIWVAAIDANAPPGADPSHPAFWLPGQDVTTQNMTAYWAPAACKASAADGACASSADCCAGLQCTPGAGGSFCQPPG